MKISLKVFALVGAATIMVACDKQINENPSPSSKQVVQDATLVDVGTAHEKIAQKLAKVLKNSKVKSFLKGEALKQFDGDYDVLFSDLINYSNANEEAVELRDLAAISKKYPLLNVAIPINIEQWNVQSYTPLVAYLPEDFDDQKTTQIPAFDADGNIHFLDVQKAPTVPVVVISQNERTELKQDKVELKRGLIHIVNDASSTVSGNNLEVVTTSDLHNSVFCGTMPFDQVLYLRGFSSNNISAIESWANGAPEIRMNIHYVNQNSQAIKVIYGNGTDQGNLWEPNKRSYVDNKWWYFTDRLFRWTSDVGEIINVTTWEEDSGSIIQFPITVKGKVAGFDVNIDAKVNIHDDDEMIGTFPVDRTFCANDTERAFGNQSLKFILDYDPY